MLFGGVYYKTQTFNATGNRACSSLLLLSVIGIVIPTAASQLVQDPHGAAGRDWILDISRICAVVLLLMWVVRLTPGHLVQRMDWCCLSYA